MTIEVLISTMNKSNTQFTEEMGIESDIVIGNQADKNDIYTIEKDGRKIRMITSTTRGLSFNRNITLENASADICLIADDDLVYKKGYVDIVMKSFEDNPKADVLIFNVEEDPIVRYVIKEKQKVGRLNYMRFGSVRIAFKLNSIKSKKIVFDTSFGSGAPVNFGEDTIFLHDCLKKGLRVIAIPETILKLTNTRDSTWFKGYDDQYFINKGKLFKRINKAFKWFLCFQDSFRHRKEYKRPWIKTFKLEFFGK